MGNRFPPWPTVYGYYRLFMEAGVWPAMRQPLLRADDHCPDRPAKPFMPRSPEELRAVLTKVERVRNHAATVSEQARLTLAVRKKFAKEAAERLRRMRVPEI